MVGTAFDYLRFCQMILNKGQWNGVRLLAPKTVELMTRNHLNGGDGDIASMGHTRFLNVNRHGQGFGLGFSVVVDLVKLQTIGSEGELAWGGVASTAFMIDPKEQMALVFMTQLVPSSTYNIRCELRTLLYQALVDPEQK